MDIDFDTKYTDPVTGDWIYIYMLKYLKHIDTIFGLDTVLSVFLLSLNYVSDCYHYYLQTFFVTVALKRLVFLPTIVGR